MAERYFLHHPPRFHSPHRILLYFVAFLTAFGAVARAQDANPASRVGRHFIVAFPPVLRGLPAAGIGEAFLPYSFIVIFASERTRVVIDGPQGLQDMIVDSAESQTYSCRPAYAEDGISHNTFDVSADHDITIYCYYADPYGAEAFSPFPVTKWDKRYVAMALPQSQITSHIRGDEDYATMYAPSHLLVIASQPTLVTVASRVDIGGSRSGTYSLNAGEVLRLAADPDESGGYNGDLSGTVITADKPIGVISGNTRTSSGGIPGIPEINGGIVGVDASAMANAAVEWLPPSAAHGTFFAYRQLSPVDPWRTSEMIRVYQPGIRNNLVDELYNNLRSILGPGDNATFQSHLYLPLNANVVAFAVQTSEPAEGMAVSGPYARSDDTSSAVSYVNFFWGTAMAELVPREHWMVDGRFRSPAYPIGMTHAVIIVAAPNSKIVLDGEPVDLASDRAGWFLHARVPVLPGDHRIVAERGSFSAIAFGQTIGTAEFRPLGAKHEGRSAQSPHPSTYTERLSVAYAYPVVGRIMTDSVGFNRSDWCDSSVITIDRVREAWPARRLLASLGDIDNVNYQMIPTVIDGATVGYRITLRPRDRSARAFAEVIAGEEGDSMRTFRYDYQPKGFDATPAMVEIFNQLPGRELWTSITLRGLGSARQLLLDARLASGAAGFTLADSNVASRSLGFDDSLLLSIGFRSDFPGEYDDTLLVEGECGMIAVPLRVRVVDTTQPKHPEPRIGGSDWRERWLSTLDRCTKSGAAGYDTAITIANSGTAPFTIASIDLLGSDAASGFFELRPPSLGPGDIVAAGTARTIGVRFRPASERPHACTVRLVTTDGDTVSGELRGIGIESHVESDDHDFGSIELLPGASVAGSVELRARPTRLLTVRELRIAGPDAGEFSFAAGFVPPIERDPTTWWYLAPGERRAIALLYAPTREGSANAWVEAIGDHASCDDSVATLTALSYRGAKPAGRSHATASGAEFASMIACDSASAPAELLNDGEVPLMIDAVEIDDPSGSFRVEPPNLPTLLDSGASIRLPVRFVPSAAGPASARLRFILHRIDSADRRDTVIAELTGSAYMIATEAHIERGYRGRPGEHQSIPIILDAPIDAARIDAITIRLPRRTSVSLLRPGVELAAMVRGTILEGWTVSLDPASSADTLVIALRAPSGGWLAGMGELLRIDASTFIGDSVGAEFPFAIELPGKGCVAMGTRPGRLELDSICGLSFRLIELIEGSYALDGNRPNPFNPVTEIIFTIGLDAPTRLAVYDGAGREVARLVDGYLGIGRYSVRWDASGYPSGVYRYRIVSGPWSAEGTMVLSK